MDLTTNSILVILIIGAVAGWLAGVIRQGYGFGLAGNIVIGILGAFIGTWLFTQLGWRTSGDVLYVIFKAVLGALLLLVLIGLVRRA